MFRLLPLLIILPFAIICNADLVVWPVDSVIKVLPDTDVPNKISNNVVMIAAKNEYENCQIAFRSTEDINALGFKIGVFTSSTGDTISSDNVKVRFVGLIQVNKSSPAASEEYVVAKPSCEIPDILLEDKTISIRADKTYSLYITAKIPEDVSAGRYETVLSLMFRGGEKKIAVELEVLPFKLPQSQHLNVTNWFIPKAIVQYHGVDPWSEEFWDMYAKYARNLAEHRQNVAHAEYEHYWCWNKKQDTSIDFNLDENGKLICDFTKFDKMVEIMQKAGVFDRLEIFYNGTFEKIGQDITLREIWAKPYGGGEKIKLSLEDGLMEYLRQLQNHLEEKGWLDKTMLHVSDEPGGTNIDSWKAASRIVHSAAPKLRRIDAIIGIGFEDELEILVPKLHDYLTYEQYYEELQRKGHEVWFYTCCQPWLGDVPNRFIDEKLVDTRLIYWLNWATKTNGFLHWGYNCWPYHFREQKWQLDSLCPGDGFVVYPGPNGPLDSLRWEQSREGIEDYEALWLLKEKMKQVKGHLGQAAADMDPSEASDAICSYVIKTMSSYGETKDLWRARKELYTQIQNAVDSPLVMLKTTPEAGSKLYYGPYQFVLEGVVEKGSSVKVNGCDVVVDKQGKFIHQVWNYQADIEVCKDGKLKKYRREFFVEHHRNGWWQWPPDKDSN